MLGGSEDAFTFSNVGRHNLAATVLALWEVLDAGWAVRAYWGGDRSTASGKSRRTSSPTSSTGGGGPAARSTAFASLAISPATRQSQPKGLVHATVCTPGKVRRGRRFSARGRRASAASRSRRPPRRRPGPTPGRGAGGRSAPGRPT